MKSFNRRSFIQTVTLAGAGIGFFNSAKAFCLSAESAPDKPIGVKLMSYNIRIASPPSKGWGFTDLQAIANAINKEQPDLVALQEVDVNTERSGKQSHQAKELGEKTGMFYHFAKAIDRSGGDYGVAVLSRFPILKAESFRLPLTLGSKGEIRAAAVIHISLFGEEIVFMSAHLDHMTDADRKLQVQELNKIIRSKSKYPLIFGADLNMKRNNPVIALLEKEVVFNCMDCPATFPADKPVDTIDYLMLNKKAFKKYNVTDYCVGSETYASDHLPLMMRIVRK